MGRAGEAKWSTASSGPETWMKSVTLTLTRRNRAPTRSATLSGRPVRKLSMQMTSQPSASSRRHRWDPRNPAPPVIRARGTSAAPAGGPHRPADPGDGEPGGDEPVGVQRVAGVDQDRV